MAKSRDKGYRHEAACVDYLVARGWAADRQPQRAADHGRPDVLALYELSPWTATVLKCEAKNRRATPVSLLLGALQQAESTKGPGIPVGVIRVAGKHVRESMAVLRWETFLELVESKANGKG